MARYEVPPVEPTHMLKEVVKAIASWFRWKITVHIDMGLEGEENFIIDRLP